MAESRRVPFTTLSCDVPPTASDVSRSLQKSQAEVLQEKESGSDTSTVRLLLTLFEPDQRSFPEFSYTQLIGNKINQSKDKPPLSRLEEEERRESDEVAAVARKLEAKYGEKPKKKQDRIQDLIDIGYGYDDEDSFIDNTEAYDEFVPASITTKFGGFYVNSGILQFRQTSDTETDDFTGEEKTAEPNKKRKLDGKQDKPKKKQCGAGGIRLNVDPSTLSETGQRNELKNKKRKKAAKMLSVTSMLKKFQKEKERERQKLAMANQRAAAVMGAATLPLFPADAAGGGSSVMADPLLSLIGSTNDHALFQAASTVDFDIDLDSFLDVGEETLSPKSLPQSATETQLFQTKTDDQTQLSTDVKAPNTKNTSQLKSFPEQTQPLSDASSTASHQCAPLPEGLPPGLEESIAKLTAAAKTSEGESKLKFFSPNINSILLDIELQCREQSGQLRSKVYTHLSSFLPCSRDTILKRVKKLFVAHVEEPSDVEDLMQKLKEAVGRSMPEQITSFHEDCQAYEQVKTSKATEEDSVEQKGGKKGGPKKLFKWNEEIRQCLGNVLKAKMDKYKKDKKGEQEVEEHLKAFLDNEVKPLWPKGWMQSRVLIKESRRLFGLFTSLQVKKAKSDKQQPTTSGASTLSNSFDSPHGTAPLTGELSPVPDRVFIQSSDTSDPVTLGGVPTEGVALKNAQVKKMEELGGVNPTTVQSDEPPGSVTPAPARSSLDLLADQALAREQSLTVSQELLTAAVAKYRHSVQHWSFDTKSPPLPPPPPQSSPINFPMSMVCQVVLPQLQQTGDIIQVNPRQVQTVSGNADVIQ
ncbi:ubinuclein-1-like [Parambassis ranga]|uniref:Ubinuclein-1-like n=1 Tax=Parambassis ranga TaxID=210632 RepID=A0A6P7KK27_9TELE|nr:ubinuclein-1 [Parambassis ranga]